MSRYLALLPAAGTGSRFGAPVRKQYARVAGAPLIHHAVRALCAECRIGQVFVVLAPDDTEFETHDWAQFGSRLQVRYCGGTTRAQSVYNGLCAMSGIATADDWVLVHDAARPCVSAAALDRLIAELGDDAVGGLLAIPVADTLKRSADGIRAEGTAARAGLWHAQTPQMFRYGTLMQALKLPVDAAITDEASAVERLGLKPRLVMGEVGNVKVTHPADLVLAEMVLSGRGRRGEHDMRAGQGYDVHRLVPGRKLIVGGVDIPHERGLAGHSDADVLLHAICDALLGAAALGDIGRHFPDTDPRYRGVDSRELLRAVSRLLAQEHWRVVSVDSTVVAQVPRMAPHIDRMRSNIAADLGVALDRVNVKAKTSEGLGFIGQGEGMAAQAVALIERSLQGQV